MIDLGYNRDNIHLWLTPTSGDLWRLNANEEWALHYMRVIGDPTGIVAIDPPGGPMLSVGDIIQGKWQIELITNNLDIRLRERDFNE